MKTILKNSRMAALMAALTLLSTAARAALFTTNTTIGINDTSYDGEDIVVAGCTLTVDGPHFFSDVMLLDNATLTHTFATNGVLVPAIQVVDEPQILASTNFVPLDQTNIDLETITVSDTNGVFYFEGNDYSVTNGSNGTTLIARVDGSGIPDGDEVLVSYTAGQTVYSGLNLTITNNLVVEAGSAINVDGRGYGGGQGTGSGLTRSTGLPYPYSAGGGGAYGGSGGYGGLNTNLAAGGASYGQFLTPTNSGSGGGTSAGGAGGNGGGVVQIAVGGAVWLDGQISANGANGANINSGGGAGGSVLISAPYFGGAGLITANGGAGEPIIGGGGGGGRIAIYYDANGFTGQISAHGGTGSHAGGAGTVFIQTGINSAQNPGQLVLDNAGLQGTNSSLALFGGGTFDVTVTGGAVLSPNGGLSGLRNLLVTSNSFISVRPFSPLFISASGNVTVQSGAGILLDGQGSAAGQGSGAGRNLFANNTYSGSGAGHGGYGGNGATGALGGNAYDNISQPFQSGSGGGNGAGNNSSLNPGGSGGGALNANISGTLRVDGVITARGLGGAGESSGGGSGGSIFITTGGFAGTGSLSADGGAGRLPNGGGGAGGMIAVATGTNTFTGSLSAHGGQGWVSGGAGTIYTRSGFNANPQLVVNNGGLQGTNTPLPFVSGTLDLVVSGGAAGLENIYSQTLHSLFIGSNSSLGVAGANQQLLQFTILSNATIQAGGHLSVDTNGAPSGSGQGAGHNISTNGIYLGGGGGYGGPGGGPGGGVYGSLTQPTLNGSGGGSALGNAPFSLGGAGGGAVSMNVVGALALDGTISANGGNGIGEGSGGGSGGSVLVNAASLSGAGQFAANGGAGQMPDGSGGGGGRIAVVCTTNHFAGSFSAHGGAGMFAGGAGSIYTAFGLQGTPQVVFDNGGLPGTNSSLPSLWNSGADVTIANGASLSLSQTSIPTIRNLLITSNSSLTMVQATSPLLLTVTGNATVQPGGRINLDGIATSPGQGSGGSTLINGITVGSGGGHGGMGGVAFGATLGGNSYDTFSEPTLPGSSGGNGAGTSPFNTGGMGGGALHLNVTGILSVGGSITANGTTGIGEGSGGGSGGGLWLTTGTFSGNGVISANGGAAQSPYGGGGGGGRIAVSFRTNSFTGLMTAHGGAGATAGGAGTVYTQSTLGQGGTFLVLDNGGLQGARTPLLESGLSGLTISGGAVAVGTGPFTLGNLLIASNSVFMPGADAPQQFLITVSTNATIQAGGLLSADGIGRSGLGIGRSGNGIFGPLGGGGGYGGLGGNDLSGLDGGNFYGSITSPTDLGSVGGSQGGGAGGGALKLTVARTLSLDGVISANGISATNGIAQGGGGSGGSLWLTAQTFTGAGQVTANGGMGALPFGGGGGGRVALYMTSNHFAGTISADGGLGFVSGGAGTVYWQQLGGVENVLIVDNGGLMGTNTVLSSQFPFNLTVSGGAVLQPALSSANFNLASLDVGPNSLVTWPGTQGRLTFNISGDARIESAGAISLDGRGYGGTAGGAGAGSMPINGAGSGAGYGGTGGASGTGTHGGATYGSIQTPTDFGSRGGIPSGISDPSFSAGGGAMHLSIGGTFTVNGTVTANGTSAVLDDAGGGSGGSIWLNLGTLAGTGLISADGGDGEFMYGDEGGGGGGGRIAIYSHTNNFAGVIEVAGGMGANFGQAGTLTLSNNVPALQIASQTPSGVLTTPVSTVSFAFNSPVDPASVTPDSVSVVTPGGVLSSQTVTVTQSDPATVTLSFPAQNMVGSYQVQLNPQGTFGVPLVTPCTGSFAIAPPVISGTVTDNNGQPAPAVTVQTADGAVSVATDAQGNYSLSVSPGWTGTVMAGKAGCAFVPGSHCYTNGFAGLSNQNFLQVPKAAMQMNCSQQGGGMKLCWFGASGVNYQVECSTNLVDWTPYGGPIAGTNGPISIAAPGNVSQMFFKFQPAQ